MVEFEKELNTLEHVLLLERSPKHLHIKTDKMFYITLNTVWKHGFH